MERYTMSSVEGKENHLLFVDNLYGVKVEFEKYRFNESHVIVDSGKLTPENAARVMRELGDNLVKNYAKYCFPEEEN